MSNTILKHASYVLYTSGMRNPRVSIIDSMITRIQGTMDLGYTDTTLIRNRFVGIPSVVIQGRSPTFGHHSQSKIEYNIFEGGNGGIFILCGGNPNLSEKLSIEFNSFLITGGGGVGIANASNCPGGIDAINNYWGTVDKDAIRAMIQDENDNITIDGKVRFERFLTEPHPDTP
jgi:hypothetical protein